MEAFALYGSVVEYWDLGCVLKVSIKYWMILVESEENSNRRNKMSALAPEWTPFHHSVRTLGFECMIRKRHICQPYIHINLTGWFPGRRSTLKFRGNWGLRCYFWTNHNIVTYGHRKIDVVMKYKCKNRNVFTEDCAFVCTSI